MAYVAYLVARLVEEFYGEWTAAYACGICLEDAKHLVYGVGRNAKTCADTAACGIAGRDKGVGSVVDVEHCALSTFCQNAFAFLQRLAKFYCGFSEGELT